MNRLLRTLVPLTVVALAAAGCSESSSGDDSDLTGETVSVIGTWGGDEQAAFLEMVKPWEEQTGAKVKYTGTRDINTVLTTGVASGVLPDLAGLPGPGQMAEYAKAGALKPLDDVLDLPTYEADTAPALVELGKVDGQVYGVFIKAAIKGLIWYNPKLHDYGASPPKTWADLLSQATANQGAAKATWCLGIESGAASGWPATDWIEDLVLRTAGPEVYTSWYQGKMKWTDPAIKNAFQMYVTDVVAKTYGGAQTAVATNFDNAGDPLFASPPGCAFLHQASFITGFSQFKTSKAGTDYNFFPFPDIDPKYAGAVEGAGDLFGMFHDTAGGQVADEVPGHRRGAGHLGQEGRRAVGEQERHQLPGRHQQAVRAGPLRREDLRVRRLGPHADRDERRVLAGHGRPDQRQQVGRPGAVRTGRRAEGRVRNLLAEPHGGAGSPAPPCVIRPSALCGGASGLTAHHRDRGGGRRPGRAGRLHLGHRTAGQR